MKILIQILTLGAILTLCGCGVKDQVASQPTPKTIDGQIFVSLYTGESFKLGSVEVALCKPSEVASNLTAYIEDTKVFMKDAKAFREKLMTKAEIYEARRDSVGMESLKMELVQFVVEKGKLQAKSAIKLYSTPAIVKVSTDADGKFQIPLDNTGNYVIMARDTVVVGGKPNEVYWIFKVTPTTKNVMLNSLNTTKIFEPDDEDFIPTLETLRDNLTK